MRPDPDDELTVPLTLDEAAVYACVSRRTVERWIAAGRLNAYTNPETGVTYVIERDLLDAEHERRHARNQGRPRRHVNAA